MQIVIACRAPHGARGLKLYINKNKSIAWRRAPHGARGLKLPLRRPSRPSYCRAPHGARGLKHEKQPEIKRLG